jgi:plastin-1
VNKYLGNDAHLKDLLPVPEKSGHVAAAAHNGVLLCKLANLARPGTIDERAINLNPTTDEQIRQNHTLCLASASALGCKVFHITPDQLTFAKDKAPTAMLDLAWELIKVSAFSPINLRDHPEIMALYPKHDPSAVSLKAPDRIILKWLNTMLTRASYKSTVKDFGVDLADGLALLHLFTQISSPTQAKNFLEAAKQPTDVRAAVITQATENLFPGMLCVVRPEDIKNGQGELLMVLLAGLFHQRSGLVDEIGGSPMKSPSGSLLLASPMKPSPMSPLANTNTSSTPTDIPVRKRERKITRVNTIDLDLEGTREERAFCAWINSLGLPGYKFVRNLHKDVANGVVLLEVLEKIAGPAASLNWSKVQREPKHRFACLANCELVVASAKLLGFSLVGISGSDIEGKNRKLILALVWQACLYHLMSILPKTKEGRRADEAYVREWANKMVRK